MLALIRTVAQMVEAFCDEERCRRLVEALVWPNGRICPACGYKRSIALAGRDMGRYRARPGLYQCLTAELCGKRGGARQCPDKSLPAREGLMRFGKVGKFAHLAPAKRCKFASHPAVRSAGIPAVSGDAKPRARGAETTSHIATRYFLAGRRAVPLARLAARCSAAGLFGSGNSADFRQITSLRLGSESASSTIRGISPRWSEESLIMAMLW
jgi:Transposase zinc-ribbon domain